MSREIKRVAVYTTIYPGVEQFLPSWYSSLLEQTDQDYELWIGLDHLEAATVEGLIGTGLGAKWVAARTGDSPATLRQRAWAQLIETCDAVVLVDSDDILLPTRIQSARTFLQSCELAACALRLVDQAGNDLGVTFNVPGDLALEDVLPRNNVFGLSNSAYCSDLLRRCLPIPAMASLVDWYLATKAWLLGAKLEFDPVARMKYRQHDANMARVLGPFTSQQVLRDTDRVRRHFELVLAAAPADALEDRLSKVKSVAADVEEFYRRIAQHPRRLREYVRGLNDLKPAPIWWSCVACPGLNSMWMASEVIKL